MITFAKRNFKEIIRDPINLIFCFAFPILILIIFQQFNIPNEVYSVEKFAPSIIIFGFCFITIFSATLVAQDRTTSLLNRLFSSPLSIFDYLFGYYLAIIPISMIQTILSLLVGSLFGLTLTINTLWMILISAFISIFFVALGILIGCAFSEKQAPAFGSIALQLMVFTSGMWFNIDTMSKGIKSVCNILPFRYVVDLSRNIVNGEFNNLLKPSLIILGYLVLILGLTYLVFKKYMTSDNK